MYAEDSDDESSDIRQSSEGPKKKNSSEKNEELPQHSSKIQEVGKATTVGKKEVEVISADSEPALTDQDVKRQVQEKAPITISDRLKGSTILSRLSPLEESDRIKKVSNCLKGKGKCDEHLSMACHLFPRLSASHLQYHDIYWDYDKDGFPHIRKRAVKVNKIIKLFCGHSIERGRKLSSAGNSNSADEFYVEFSLIDRRPVANKQVVSNIYSIPVGVTGSLPIWNIGRARHSTGVLVRSNYATNDVLLQITWSLKNQPNVIGRSELELLDDAGKLALQNKLYFCIFGDKKFEFEVIDVPPGMKKIESDSLPDVILCNEAHIEIITLYRQLLCQYLGAKSHTNSVCICDPLLSTFPKVIERPELADLLVHLLNRNQLFQQLKNYAERNSSILQQIFRQTYTEKIFQLLFLCDDDSNDTLKRRIEEAKNGKPDRIGSSVLELDRCKPFSMTDLTIQLHSNHSLD